MVTKSLRTQMRRTHTPGKVPLASDLLEGELCMNVPDRKLYAKGTTENVFQLTAAPGRQVGNSPVYEGFLGSNLQGLGVNNDGRIWLKHDKDKISDYTTLQVTRTIDPDATGDNVAGLTSAAVLISTEIKKSGVTTFQWPLSVLLTYDPADGLASPNSEHVVIFGGGTKKADAGMWGANIGISDQVTNPATASIGFELTMGAKGLDPNNQRFGLLLAFGSAPANQGGTNEVTYGVTFGAPAGQCLLKAAVNFDCTAYTALNFTTMGSGRGQSVMKMKPGYKIEWADSLFSPVQARLGFDGTAFDLGGVVTTASASAGAAAALPAAPAFYSTIKINDNYVKIPCYPA